MNIEVLGSGCPNCQTLERRTREALAELHLDATIEKVQDMQAIVSYGVMRTPCLVIDGRVVIQGAVPKVDALKELLTKHAGAR